MIANYHTHTKRCNHASGTDEEYVAKAIAEGLEALGFSDHAPTVYNEPYMSYYKMQPDEIGDYFSSLCALREKYADKIEIHIGYEAEYLPDVFENSLALWKKSHAPEYLILGQHFTDFEIKDRTFGDRSYYRRDYNNPLLFQKERLTRYVDGVIEGLSTEIFSCLAHPDLLTFHGDEDFYLSEMLRLIEAAVKYGVPLEFNLLGLREGRLYPNRKFWELAARTKASVIMGCDAHAPEDVADPENINEGREYLSSLGIKPLDKMELRRVF